MRAFNDFEPPLQKGSKQYIIEEAEAKYNMLTGSYYLVINEVMTEYAKQILIEMIADLTDKCVIPDHFPTAEYLENFILHKVK